MKKGDFGNQQTTEEAVILGISMQETNEGRQMKKGDFGNLGAAAISVISMQRDK